MFGKNKENATGFLSTVLKLCEGATFYSYKYPKNSDVYTGTSDAFAPA
jgi:hypothetical protein